MPHRSFEAGIEPGIVGAGLGCKTLHNFDRIAARACLVFGIVHFSDGRARQYQETQDNQRDRSEEHTSELQSLMRISYAVFCLKKKRTILDKYQTPITTISYSALCNN